MAGRISGITIEIGGDTTKLQTALKGVDSQLRTTQSTLKDVNKLLKLDPGNTELLTQKQKNLEKAISQTKDRLSQLKDAQKGVAQGTPEWDALQREIIETEQNLQGLERELQNFGSVGAQQIAAAGQAMIDFGDKCVAAGQKFAPISAAAAGLVGALVGLGMNSLSAADDLSTLSQQTGISTDSLQKFEYASDRVDVSTDDIVGAVAKMKKGMAGSGEAFEALGVSITDSEGNMRGVEEVFYEVLGALSGIPNETERDQAAMDIFGKSADKLAGIIDDGGAALQAYGQEAEELGLILSGETLDALNETNDAVDKSKAQLKAATNQLGGVIATGLAPVIEKLAGFVEKLVGWMQKLTPEQTNLIITIASVIAAISPVLIIGGKIISGVGKILQLAPMLASAFSFLISPIGLVIAEIAAAVAIGVILYKNWDKIEEWAVTTWNNIVTTVTTAVENAKAAIQEWVSDAITKVKEFVSNIKNGISELKNQITVWIQTYLITPATNKIAEFVNLGKRIVSNIKQGISSAWDSLVNWFNEIWNKLWKDKEGSTGGGEGGGGGGSYASSVPSAGPRNYRSALNSMNGMAAMTTATAPQTQTVVIDYNRLAEAISSRPIVIQGDTSKIFRVVKQTNTVRTRATNYNALAFAGG